jgi:hypothetical protein
MLSESAAPVYLFSFQRDLKVGTYTMYAPALICTEILKQTLLFNLLKKDSKFAQIGNRLRHSSPTKDLSGLHKIKTNNDSL